MFFIVVKERQIKADLASQIEWMAEFPQAYSAILPGRMATARGWQNLAELFTHHLICTML